LFDISLMMPKFCYFFFFACFPKNPQFQLLIFYSTCRLILIDVTRVPWFDFSWRAAR
jgi:hypothetical protein